MTDHTLQTSTLNSKKLPSILTLLLIFGLAPAVVVLVAPALLQISQWFHVSSITARYSISMSLCGYALGPLISGPLSNHHGRKYVIYLGLGLLLFACLLGLPAILWHDFYLFLASRTIMGFGGAVAMPMVYAMVHDAHEDAVARRVLSLVVAAFAFIPGLTSLLAGMITSHFGWQYIQLLMTLYAVATLLLVFKLPETYPTLPKKPLLLSALLPHYLHVLKNNYFWLFSCLVGFSIAILYVYVAGSAYLGLMVFHLPSDQFGIWSFIPYVGIAVVLTITGKFSHRLKYWHIVWTGAGVAVVASVLFGLCMWLKYFNPTVVFIYSTILLSAIMPINVSSVTMANKMTGDRGATSALIVFIFMIMAILAQYLFNCLLPLTHALDYLLMIGLLLIGLLINARLCFCAMKKR